jgi:hypothetical protein
MGHAMTPYDAEAWREIQRWKEKKLRRKERHLVPAQWRERTVAAAHTAKDQLESLPGADRFEELLLNALQGLMGLAAKAALASVRESAVVEAYRKKGHLVTDLEDIRKLELRDVDRQLPKLEIIYAAAAAVEGAASGAVVSGGELLAAVGGAAGAGAGAAPGAATVIGAIAADAAAVLVAANRVIGHTAAYYGYDVEKSAEALFALGVLGVGTATQAGKTAAYIELNKVVQNLARNKTWEVLNKSVVTKVINQVYTRLGMTITKEKLGQSVPVLGIVLGAGLNARLISRVADNAEWLYRERFLAEKYGIDNEPPPSRPGDGPSGPGDAPGGVVSIQAIVDDEVADDRGP